MRIRWSRRIWTPGQSRRARPAVPSAARSTRCSSRLMCARCAPGS